MAAKANVLIALFVNPQMEGLGAVDILQSVKVRSWKQSSEVHRIPSQGRLCCY